MFVDLEELKEYNVNDHFFFDGKTELQSACNIPRNSNGVYQVYELKNGRITLVYIGSSGKIQCDGSIRQGTMGLFESIVNGEQFGGPRKKTWKKKLITEGIDALDIYWYETYNQNVQHLPSFVQGLILQIHLDFYNKLPDWNIEY